MGLLDGGIKKIVGNALKDQLLDLSVTDPNPGTYDPDTQGFTGSTAPTAYSCKGIVDRYNILEQHDENITRQDRKITILAATLKDASGNEIKPKKEWTVTDDEGNDFEIVELSRDPAGATWEIQGRL